MIFLLFRAEFMDGEHDESALHAGEAAKSAVAALEFLHDETVSDVVHVRAAVFLREVCPEQAHGSHVWNEV